MGHGKPHGSFGQGSDLYGEGEMVPPVAYFPDFFCGVPYREHVDRLEGFYWIPSGIAVKAQIRLSFKWSSVLPCGWM